MLVETTGCVTKQTLCQETPVCELNLSPIASFTLYPVSLSCVDCSLSELSDSLVEEEVVEGFARE